MHTQTLEQIGIVAHEDHEPIAAQPASLFVGEGTLQALEASPKGESMGMYAWVYM